MSELFDRLTYRQIAKTIDHSLLRPELDDAFVEDGIRLAAQYDVASATVRPTDVVKAVEMLRGTDVKVGTVVGFPHGDVLTETKVFEAHRALEQGAQELDMVIQIAWLQIGSRRGRAGRHSRDRRGRPRGRRDRQGDLRERLPDRRREDPRLPADRGRGWLTSSRPRPASRPRAPLTMTCG